MAKISSVDYEAIPKKAATMREKGKYLNKEITTAYTSIENMSSSWYGVRYNELVSSFNEVVSTINEMLTLVVTDIPYALETVANNYAKADKGSAVCSPSNDKPTKVTAIPKSTATGMKFISSQVKTVQTNVSKNFTNAVTYMNEIETTYNSINWTSEAATAFKKKFKTLKSNITTSFNDIKTDFSQLMSAAESDISSAENSNTVS